MTRTRETDRSELYKGIEAIADDVGISSSTF